MFFFVFFFLTLSLRRECGCCPAAYHLKFLQSLNKSTVGKLSVNTVLLLHTKGISVRAALDQRTTEPWSQQAGLGWFVWSAAEADEGLRAERAEELVGLETGSVFSTGQEE